MLTHRTALLRHTLRAEQHFDWLIHDPRPPHPSHAYWTLRVPLPTWQWCQTPSLIVESIAHHRKHYLRYQGPVSGGRGSVMRVDEGSTRCVLWSESVRRFVVRFHHLHGAIDLHRLSERRWRLVPVTNAHGPVGAAAGCGIMGM